MKLLFVVLYEKQQKMEVAVEDDAGRKRRVEIDWQSKSVLPVHRDWFSMVESELAQQDAEELDRQKGRVLFR